MIKILENINHYYTDKIKIYGATLKASEINRDRVEDATKFLEVGQEVEAKIINVDRKSRSINLSIKAKDEAEEKEALNNARQAAAQAGGDANGPKTLGDLIKAAQNK